METQKFPLTLAAYKKREMSQWDIGDALIDECGPASGRNGDSKDQRIKAAHKYIVAAGFDCEERTLYCLRQVATEFPLNSRRMEISWSAHRAAKTPERLNAIIAGAKTISDVTADYVNTIIEAQLVEAQAAYRNEARRAAEELAKAEEAEHKAREEERKAHDRADAKEEEKARKKREKAEKRTEKAREEKKKKKTPPKKSDAVISSEDNQSLLVARAELMANVAQANVLASQTSKLLDSVLYELSDTTREAFAYEAVEVAGQWQSLASRVKKQHGSKNNSFLEVVERSA
jgi:hypothetical protein